MKSDKYFQSTLADNICDQRGAMAKPIGDRAKVAICIEDWQSESYHEHQNYYE
jgi:hypothetical protein